MPRNLHALMPVESLDYGLLISQVLQVYRNPRTIEELIQLLGPGRFADITEHPTSQYLATEDPLPPEYDQKVFLFNPGRRLAGIADFVFLTPEEHLVSVRLQMVFSGLFKNRKAARYLDSELIPLLRIALGEAIEVTGTHSRFDGRGLVVIARHAPRSPFVSTYLIAEEFA